MRVLDDRQESRGEGDSRVVAETGCPDGEEIHLEGRAAVDGGVRLAQQQEDPQRGTDERYVHEAAGKAQPGPVEAAPQDVVQDHREEESRKIGRDPDRGLGDVVAEQNAAERNRKEQQDQQQTHPGNEKLALRAGVYLERIGWREESLEDPRFGRRRRLWPGMAIAREVVSCGGRGWSRGVGH
jgi:hypothetical protein